MKNIITRFDIKAHRYFKNGSPNPIFEVMRIIPGLKVPLGVTIASTLIVASWVSVHFSFLKQLTALGRTTVLG